MRHLVGEPRFWALGATAGLALWLGFLAFDAPLLEALLRDWSVAVLALLVALAVVLITLLVVREGRGFRVPLGLGGGVALVVLAAVVVLGRPHGFNIMFDEVVYASVAQAMVEEGLAGFVVDGERGDEGFLVRAVQVDKRPGLYPFLVALAHAVTGYRVDNSFLVNGLLACWVMGAGWRVAAALAGSAEAGLLTAALLAGLPLLAQSASGGGLEMLTLALLLGLLSLGTRWLESGSERALAALVAATLLLANTRLEAGLFVLATMALAVIGWRRHRRVVIPRVAVVAPLFLVPVVWYYRVSAAAGNAAYAWDGVAPERLFSWSSVPGNLRSAGRFLLSPGLDLPNSLLLSVAGGVAAVVWMAALLRRRGCDGRPGLTPAETGFAAVGAVVLVTTVLLLGYYVGHWDRVVVSRLSLPLHLVLALAVAAAAGRLVLPRTTVRGALALSLLFVVAVAVPKNLRSAELRGYRERLEIHALMDHLRGVPGDSLVAVSTSPQAAMLLGVEALSFADAAADPAALRRLVAGGRRPVVAFQVVRRLRTEQAWFLLPTHRLPPGYEVEPLASLPLVDDTFLVPGVVRAAAN